MHLRDGGGCGCGCYFLIFYSHLSQHALSSLFVILSEKISSYLSCSLWTPGCKCRCFENSDVEEGILVLWLSRLPLVSTVPRIRQTAVVSQQASSLREILGV